MALGGAVGLAWSPATTGTPRHFTSTFVSRGRCDTISHPPSFRVAGVALMALGFTKQAWHKRTSTIVSHGGRGTRGSGWCAWTGLVARDARDAAALCVAGVTTLHPPSFHVAGVHNLTSTIVSRGRRGTHGTRWRAWTGLVARDARDAAGLCAALCVAGVAQPYIHLRFTRQACTIPHPPSFRVGGVALMALGGALGLAWSPVTPGTPRDFARHFAWKARHNLTSTCVLRGRRGTDGSQS